MTAAASPTDHHTQTTPLLEPAVKPSLRAWLTPENVARLTRRWLVLWCFLLAGLAIDGRGFAYIGVPPLFISEFTLLLGGLVLLIQPRWKQAIGQPVILLILLMLAWGLMRTLPYLGQWKLDAVRDFMLLGYSATAVIVAAVVMSHPRMLPWLLARYQTFVKFFLIVMPPIWLLDQVMGKSMPVWPWASHVGIITLKPGDMPVHLGAIAALSILGLFRGKSLMWMALLCVLLGVTGSISRGGLVAFALAFSVAFSLRPTSAWATRLTLILVVVVTFVAVSDVSIKVPGREREFSARQLLLNVASIVDSDIGAGDLDDTKTWRLEWWQTIANYTIYGDYFWAGKGFGVNLANSDGFQVHMDSESLRSPHNGHLNVLARTGVPGMLIWCAILMAWFAMIVNAYLLARQRKDGNWAMFFALLTAYWMSLNINAAVDVYFEGPMGGVWFWSITGLGVGAVWVFKHHPEVMHVEHATPREG